MINRLRRTNQEQRKLLFSVVTNFLTRIPGVVGLLWFLPMLRFGLGIQEYANLLAAIAFASVAAFLCGGYHLMGRRMVGEAYANHDKQAEADTFMSVLAVNAATLCISLAITVIYCRIDGCSNGFLIVAAIWVIGLTLQMFDNVRSAYNEMYLGSILLIVFQSLAYTIGFSVPAIRQNFVVASLVLNGPYVLTSLATLVLLLRHKPHLIRGHPIAVRYVAKQGTMFAMADGFLFATLSFAVVWMQHAANPDTAAWFGTIVRLFQSFLVPVALLMLPISSYVRILWKGKSLAQRQAYTKATLVIGIGYGAFVAVTLSILSNLYVQQLLHLFVPHDWSIFVLFAAIVAYKSYSSIAYVVLTSTHLSSWTTIAVVTAVVFGALVSTVATDPLRVIDVYAMVAGLLMIAVLIWNATRFVRLSDDMVINASA